MIESGKMNFKGTKEVAKLLDVNVSTLSQAVWTGRIPEPQRMGGAFLWSIDDINRASWVLLHRVYKPVEKALATPAKEHKKLTVLSEGNYEA